MAAAPTAYSRILGVRYVNSQYTGELKYIFHYGVRKLSNHTKQFYRFFGINANAFMLKMEITNPLKKKDR